jgi:cytidyltransferase-like protein
MILYADMVADLFHYGHIEFIKNIHKFKNEGDEVVIGIHNDETVKSYKRIPVMTMEERIRVVESCKYVDRVIANSPLIKTQEYINLNKIDYIFIPDNRTESEIKHWLEVPLNMGIVRIIPYTPSISTTDIINKIINNY